MTGSSARAADVTTTSPTTTTTAPVSTTTTFDLKPLTPSSTTTTRATAPPTTEPPMPVVTGAGAVLAKPAAAGPPRTMSALGCKSLGDDGWTVADCGRAATRGSHLVWLVETKGSKGRRVLVFRPSAGATTYEVVLEARDDLGQKWSAAAARVVDLSGDSFEEVVVGFRSVANGPLLLDVVEGTGSVVVHRDLAGPGPSARVSRASSTRGRRPRAAPSTTSSGSWTGRGASC